MSQSSLPPDQRASQVNAVHFRVSPLLAEHLKRCGLADDDRFELAFHLSEILSDLAVMAPLITSGAAPTREQVLDLVGQVVYHWPYHAKHAARLEAKMTVEPE